MKGLKNFTSQGVFLLLSLGRMKRQWNGGKEVDDEEIP